MHTVQELRTFYNSFKRLYRIHVNELGDNTCCLLEKQI